MELIFKGGGIDMHTHVYHYASDEAVISIMADNQDSSYEILKNIVKKPEDFKLYDSETVDG